MRSTGHEARLVCRYHGWTYGLDGSLRAASRTPEGFDRSQLRPAPRARRSVFAGMIFINFDAEPGALRSDRERLAAPLAPYQLGTRKVAYQAATIRSRSNWKLAVENYCECYHCAPAHPEYSIGHGRAIAAAE